jgi:aromatic-L-amino-acid/L-tryptophan decarboxylase
MGKHPLEPSVEEMRAMLAAAGAFSETFVEGLAGAPASGPVDPALHEQIRGTIGEHPGSLDAALELLREATGEGFNTTSGGFMAYIPGGGLYAAAVADYLACVVNRYVGIAPPAPAMVEIEWRAVRWLCDLFAYPDQARGVLTSGGSIANFSAIVAARYARLGDDLRDGRVYATDQVHHSVLKAVRLAGLPPDAVRVIPRDAELRMEPEALTEAITEDRRAGRRPCAIVASVGTTNTGAIDPLPELAQIASIHDVWLHVDAAYGGFFQLTERGRDAFRGIERADSITLDPHKGMFLPYGTGALIVRDGQALRTAHAATADYLQDLASEEEVLPNFGEYSPEFTRDFRGLRVWLPLVVHGVAAFRAALDEKLDLAALLHQLLAAIPELELPWPAGLTVVPFRVRGDESEPTRRLLERVNATRRVFFSSTTIDSRVYIRPCIVVHRTHQDRIEEAAAIIRQAVNDLGVGREES